MAGAGRFPRTLTDIGIAQHTFRKVKVMKKLGFLALALCLSAYSLGCGKTATPPAAAPATTPATGESAPAAEGEKATEEAGHEHAAEGTTAPAEGATK